MQSSSAVAEFVQNKKKPHLAYCMYVDAALTHLWAIDSRQNQYRFTNLLPILPLFVEDLNGITAYIANTLKNPAAAHKLIDNVEHNCYGATSVLINKLDLRDGALLNNMAVVILMPFAFFSDKAISAN